MIQIPENKIIDAARQGMDEFLKVFADAYLDEVDGTLSAENMPKLTGYQHALLAYRFFQEEINQGGFVQLIQNGFGGYIFDNPTAKAWKMFGAAEAAKILYKAKEIYDTHRTELERETTDEEFTAMYVDFEQFDELEENYFLIEEEQTAKIASFVDNHIEEFAQII
ncbi:MAG TPA: DMP19 family protein [Dysgonamonadaceae bacterium]|nr:DMP19 family protein [Dysgonamonadaceae bacterium]